MALSQKHKGKCFVPWFSSVEWHLVYEKIFGINHNKETQKEALNIIHIWKARTPFLSRGVEGTYIILEAVLLDRSAYDIYNLKLLCSASIMRFLNICAVYNKNQGTFSATALKMQLPEWLINLRHEIAHGQCLPSMDVLNRALEFSLKWLNDEYWKPTSSEIKDFVDSTQCESDKRESLKYILQPLVSNYCYITLLTHSYWNYKIIENIANKEIRDLFLGEIRNMIDSQEIDNSTELTQILKLLWHKIIEILNQSEDVKNRYFVLAELIVEDVFLGNFEERKEIFQDDSDAVPEDFIILWKHMFLNLDTNMLEALIVKLVETLSVDNISHECKTVAATWLLQIAKSFEKFIFTKNVKKQKKELKEEAKAMLGNVLFKKYRYKTVLKLSNTVDIPSIISDHMKFKNVFIENPNEYTKIFISEMLNLNEILKLECNKEPILELINVYISNGDNENETIKFTEVYSVEESTSPMETEESINELLKQSIAEELFGNGPSAESSNSNKIWRKVTEINFEKTPLGLLPWQSTTMNPLLS